MVKKKTKELSLPFESENKVKKIVKWQQEEHSGSMECYGLKNVFVCINELAYNDDWIEYSAWTDGACDNMHPEGPGGSAYLILKDNTILIQRSKGFKHTTNNRMEMLAIISAMKYVASISKKARIDIYSDSQYSINVFSGRWRGKMNFDLIDLFKEYAKKMNKVVFHWVKGHSGVSYNEMADRLSYEAYLQVARENGYEIGKYV